MTFIPGRANFRFYRGATFSTENITIDDADGVAEDLTGWTGLMQMWREDVDPVTGTPVFSSAGVAPLITLNDFDTTGVVNGTIAATDALVDVAIDGETWYFRLDLTDPAQNPDLVQRELEGYVIAFP